MKWALERVIEFMFAIMLLIGAGTVGYEIKNWEMGIKVIPVLQAQIEEARGRVIEYQEKLKSKGKVSIVEYQQLWVECK